MKRFFTNFLIVYFPTGILFDIARTLALDGNKFWAIGLTWVGAIYFHEMSVYRKAKQPNQ